MDEPESLAGVALGGREHLDNLIFVVNCNLQRLDGPVRGDAKIIQELEGLFRGAGWNVIKLVWGREWDPLLAADTDGVLVDKMNATVDGEFQKYRVENGAYIRDHFFGPDPRLQQLVADRSDDELRRLRRGGHDPAKVYAAYTAACDQHDAPTVILAQTVKGWALGPDFEARNATHQIKKMTEAELRTFRDRLELPITDEALAEELPPYAHPGFDSPEYQYLMERRRTLGGHLPERRVRPKAGDAARPRTFDELLTGTGDKVAASTTGAFTRLLRNLLRDPGSGIESCRSSPTRRARLASTRCSVAQDLRARGQLYEPVDAELLLSYQEAADGQILEEGITEAGAMASFTAAGTAYATWGEPMVPFFIYYSMFGFHRFADLLWAAGDMRARGFLLAATAGRTTLQGEGLQHCDGHSLLFASAVPNLRAYDPAFAYEVAVIVRDGITRMYGPDPEDLVYYLTLYNEPSHNRPCLPVSKRDPRRPLPLPHAGERTTAPASSRVAPRCSPRSRRNVLFDHHDVAAEVWSATSYKALRDRRAGRRTREPSRSPAKPRGSLLAHVARVWRRTGCCRYRLRQARRRPGRTLDAPAVRVARHRWLRSVRHSAGAAPPLRNRRRPHRRRGALRACSGRAT